MSRATDEDHRELIACHSCDIYTEKRCPRHPGIALCGKCECAWVREVHRYHHIVVAPGTPFIRWYMGKWPAEIPPPRTKRYAHALDDVLGNLDSFLEIACSRFAVIWDREDALLAIAERAVRIHTRDAVVIDGWNEYVKRENAKRKLRRLRGWRNRYYSRTIRPFRGR